MQQLPQKSAKSRDAAGGTASAILPRQSFPADRLEQETHMTRHIRLEYGPESLIDEPAYQCTCASREAIAWISGMECKRRADVGQEALGTMRIVMVILWSGLSYIFCFYAIYMIRYVFNDVVITCPRLRWVRILDVLRIHKGIGLALRAAYRLDY